MDSNYAISDVAVGFLSSRVQELVRMHSAVVRQKP